MAGSARGCLTTALALFPCDAKLAGHMRTSHVPYPIVPGEQPGLNMCVPQCPLFRMMKRNS